MDTPRPPGPSFARSKTETRDAVHSVDKEVYGLGLRIDGAEKRLDAVELLASGANTAAIAAGQAKPVPWLKLAGFGLTLLIIGSGAMVSFTEKPSRSEFKEAGEKAQASYEQLRSQLDSLEREAIRMRAALEAAQKDQATAALGQDRLEHKIDQLIRGKR